MKNGIDIFRHILFRIAGESFAVFGNNNANYQNIKDSILQVIVLKAEKERLKVDFCDALFPFIKDSENDAARKALINLKRDVYNERNISDETKRKINVLLTDVLREKYNKYNLLNELISEENLKYHNYFAEGYIAERQSIKELCKKDTINSGLLLSSDVLLKSAQDFASGLEIAEGDILGLWKYITRVVTKPTPYSTFTQLNIGTIKDKVDDVFSFSEISPKIISHIRYNNYILEFLLLLLKNHPLISGLLRVAINPTIKKNEDGWLFFTNNNNSESFQTIKFNAIIEYIINTVSNESNITIQSLVIKIIEVLEEGFNEGDVKKYLFELAQTGLLFIDIDFSGLDSEWDKSLSLLLNKNIGHIENGQRIITILNDLVRLRNEYAQSNTKQRKNILELINNLFNELVSLLSIDTPARENEKNIQAYDFIKPQTDLKDIFLNRLPFKADQLSLKNVIYEDSSRDITISISENRISDFISLVDMLMKSFSFVFNDESERNGHYHFFQKNFTGEKQVELLRFYELLYKKKLSFKPDERKEVIDSDSFNAKSFFDKVRADLRAEAENGHIIYANHCCELTQEFFNSFNNKNSVEVKKRSFASFIQFYIDGTGELTGVTNGVTAGKGKMIGRFLHLFEQSVTDDLKKWNVADLEDNEIFVENSDASFFNANLHPCLMPYEIQMPGGNNRSPENIVHVTDLVVIPNSTKEQLELWTKSGKRVSIFDLGFQSLMGRSHLYRLLCSFGNNNGFPIFSISNLFNEIFFTDIDVPESTLKIKVFPRLVVLKKLIIQRKRWIVPIEVLTSIVEKHRSMSNEHLFLAIQKWRIALSIPDHSFIRINHFFDNKGKKTSKTFNRDDYKPQYINFLSPTCFKLLIKNINKVEKGTFTFEEMLPEPEKLLKISGSPYVIENLVQWQ